MFHTNKLLIAGAPQPHVEPEAITQAVERQQQRERALGRQRSCCIRILGAVGRCLTCRWMDRSLHQACERSELITAMLQGAPASNGVAATPGKGSASTGLASVAGTPMAPSTPRSAPAKAARLAHVVQLVRRSSVAGLGLAPASAGVSFSFGVGSADAASKASSEAVGGTGLASQRVVMSKAVRTTADAITGSKDAANSGLPSATTKLKQEHAPRPIGAVSDAAAGSAWHGTVGTSSEGGQLDTARWQNTNPLCTDSAGDTDVARRPASGPSAPAADSGSLCAQPHLTEPSVRGSAATDGDPPSFPSSMAASEGDVRIEAAAIVTASAARSESSAADARLSLRPVLSSTSSRRNLR